MFKKSFTIATMSLNEGFKESEPSAVEIEDRVHFLRIEEGALRERYEKCITWNVKVIYLICRDEL